MVAAVQFEVNGQILKTFLQYGQSLLFLVACQQNHDRKARLVHQVRTKGLDQTMGMMPLVLTADDGSHQTVASDAGLGKDHLGTAVHLGSGGVAAGLRKVGQLEPLTSQSVRRQQGTPTADGVVTDVALLLDLGDQLGEEAHAPIVILLDLPGQAVQFGRRRIALPRDGNPEFGMTGHRCVVNADPAIGGIDLPSSRRNQGVDLGRPGLVAAKQLVETADSPADTSEQWLRQAQNRGELAGSLPWQAAPDVHGQTRNLVWRSRRYLFNAHAALSAEHDCWGPDLVRVVHNHPSVVLSLDLQPFLNQNSIYLKALDRGTKESFRCRTCFPRR